LLALCLTVPLQAQGNKPSDTPQAVVKSPAEKQEKAQSLDEKISDWNVHPSLAFDIGTTLLPVLLFDKTYITPQFRIGGNARVYAYLVQPWYLGCGVSLRYSTDTDSSRIIIRPGALNYGADLAFGWLAKPKVSSTFTPGLEGRFGAELGVINGTNLYFFYLKTTVRPYARLFGSHFEVGLPLSIDWRKDPEAAFDLALEVALVL